MGRLEGYSSKKCNFFLKFEAALIGRFALKRTIIFYYVFKLKFKLKLKFNSLCVTKKHCVWTPTCDRGNPRGLGSKG